MNDSKKNLIFSYLTIAAGMFSLGAFLWLQQLPLWLNSRGRIIWQLKSLAEMPLPLFFFSCLPLFLWLLSASLFTGISKETLKKTLSESARTFSPLFFLLLPLLGLNSRLNGQTNFFLYLATDLAWPYCGLITVTIIFLQISLFNRVIPRHAKPVPTRTNRWLKYIIFAVVLTAYLILKSNFIPWDAEGKERFKLFTGDEPQYCLITHSLVFDRDFDLKNNLDNRDYNSFYPYKMNPHGLPNWPNSDRYSYHRLGLPLLIAPAYYLGHESSQGVRQIILCFLNIFGALLAVVIYLVCLKKTNNQFAAAAAAVIIAFTNPLIIYAQQIYPEMPAGFFILCAFALAANRPLLASCSIAALPWLHERFGPIALVLTVYLLLRTGWHKRKLLLIFLPLAVSAILQVLYYQKMYGLPFPIQESWVEGSYDSQFGFFNKTGFHTGLVGLLLDRAEGLLIYAPIFALSLTGIFIYWRQNRREALWFIIILLSYFLPVGLFGFWWGGGAPPPRVVVAIIPRLSLPLALAQAKIKTFPFRVTFAFLTLLSLLLGFYLITHPEFGYDFGKFFRRYFAFSNATMLMNLKNYFPSLFINTGTTTVLSLLWSSLIIITTLIFLSKKQTKSAFIYLITVMAIVFLIIQLGDSMAGNLGRLTPNNMNKLAKNALRRGSLANNIFLLYEAELLNKRIGINHRSEDASGNYACYAHHEKVKEDFLVSGPYETLPAGKYRAQFLLKTSKTTGKDIAVLDVATDLGLTVLSQRTIIGSDFHNPGSYQTFPLNFSLPQETGDLEFRVYFLDEGDLFVDYIKIEVLPE